MASTIVDVIVKPGVLRRLEVWIASSQNYSVNVATLGKHGNPGSSKRPEMRR